MRGLWLIIVALLLGFVPANAIPPNASGVVVVPSYNAPDGIVPVKSASAEGSHVIKATFGNLYGFSVTTGAVAGLVMLFDATSAPGDGAVTPVKCYEIGATSTIGASWYPGPPMGFVNGLVIVFSTGTNCFNKAISATAFISGEAN